MIAKLHRYQGTHAAPILLSLVVLSCGTFGAGVAVGAFRVGERALQWLVRRVAS